MHHSHTHARTHTQSHTHTHKALHSCRALFSHTPHPWSLRLRPTHACTRPPPLPDARPLTSQVRSLHSTNSPTYTTKRRPRLASATTTLARALSHRRSKCVSQWLLRRSPRHGLRNAGSCCGGGREDGRGDGGGIGLRRLLLARVRRVPVARRTTGDEPLAWRRGTREEALAWRVLAAWRHLLGRRGGAHLVGASALARRVGRVRQLARRVARLRR